MRRLAVLRHAKTEPPASGMADFDRALKERGWQDAGAIGEAIRDRRMQFDLVLASTARRVRETAEGVMKTSGIRVDIRFEPRIYEATAGMLKDMLRQLPDECGSVLIVGHNPTMHQLVLDLADSDGGGLRDLVRMRYPTATLAAIDLPATHWSEVRDGSGKIVELIFPRDFEG